MARKRKQRRELSEDEVNAYLDRRAEWAVLTTVGRDGRPHSVPLGYFRLGGHLYLGMREGSQKIKNIERNPHVSVLVTSAKATGDITGVLVQGSGTLIRDPGRRLELARGLARQRGAPETELPDSVSEDGVYVQVTRERVVSWNYR